MKLLAHKKGYLNSTFFIIRWVVYFLIWGVMGRFLFRSSVKQDETGKSSGKVATKFSLAKVTAA